MQSDRRPSKRPAWLCVLALVTGAYLLVEMGFNSRLLDVVGGGASLEQIHSIERWGRGLSGFALALFFWKSRFPDLFATFSARYLDGLGKLVAITFACMFGMYLFQEILVDVLVERSSAQERKVAQNLVLLQQALVSGASSIEGLGIEQEAFDQPDAKAFMAFFPLAGGAALGELVLDKFSADMRKEVMLKTALTKMGDANAHFDAYKKILQDGIQPGWQQYQDGNRRVWEERAKRRKVQDDAWRDYAQSIREQSRGRGNPARIPVWHRKRVVDQLRQKGIRVPDGWGGNRAQFNAAVAQKHEQEIAYEFQQQLAAHDPRLRTLPPELSAQEFMRHAAVQRIILEELHYSCIRAFPPPSTAQQFLEQVFQAEARCVAKRELKLFSTLARDHDQAAKDAMKTLIVPPLALLFSLLGAFVHFFKLVCYVVRLALGEPSRHAWIDRAVLCLAPLLVMLGCATMLDNRLTRSALYTHFEERMPVILALPVRATIHGQVFGYPIFSGVREHVLRGFNFGYDQSE